LGLDAQSGIRQELEGGTFLKSAQNPNMAQYFINLRGKLKRLEFPVTDNEFLFKISKHFNKKIENLLTNLLHTPRAINKAYKLLQNLYEKESLSTKNK
jgi:hypothetical protein